MKRRYKAGDWFRVPLRGECDALGVIAAADRSRLFGYFFPAVRGASFDIESLRALRSDDAILRTAFGGAAIEELRWPVIARSIALQTELWPLPGAAARSRYATPSELEALLHARLRGERETAELRVYERRSPLVLVGDALPRGARLQIRDGPSAADVRELARWLESDASAQLRVHGAAARDADPRWITAATEVRSLLWEPASQSVVNALAPLRALRALRVDARGDALDLRPLGKCASLEKLAVRAAVLPTGSLDDLRALRELSLDGTSGALSEHAAWAATLCALALANAPYDLRIVRELPALESLELRSMQLDRLPSFERNAHLRTVVLHDVRSVRDLVPLAALARLEHLTIEGMPQLEVSDFAPFAAMERLPALAVDVGSRKKTREIYRLLRERFSV